MQELRESQEQQHGDDDDDAQQQQQRQQQQQQQQPPPGSGRKARKSRGRGLRTTTGCAICRRRHMKCDELKPVCTPCAKGSRPCVYTNLAPEHRLSVGDGSDPIHVVDLPPPSPVQVRSNASCSSTAPSSLPKRASFSTNVASDGRPPSRQKPPTPTDDTLHILSPQSSYSSSTGYGTEVAPLRWFGLLAGDAAHLAGEVPGLEALSDAALQRRHEIHPDGASFHDARRTSHPHPGFADGLAQHNPTKLLQISAISPLPSTNSSNDLNDERQYWQAVEPVQLKDHEYDVFHGFVTGISLWIDLFDPKRHFSTFVPHLAMRNEGLMKAVLALGARHLSIKSTNRGEASIDRTGAVGYYHETLQYLQSAMRFTSYKNSLELLATVLVVSKYEMIDGAGKDWQRHLKGVFWIQRSREINGESGGFEQAVWWAWLRQDVWAAFREHRRCFSFFKPTKPYHAMDTWDMASKVVYILAQAVNYSSEEEKVIGERDLADRILKANTLLNMLEEWRTNVSVHFQPLPVEGPANRAFRPLWIHPGAFGTSVQMYSMARILLLTHQPAAGGYLEYLSRDRIIVECIDTIGGIAIKINDDASRLMSTQCLFAAGLYCTDDTKRGCIAELIQEHQGHTGWPANGDLAAELQQEWARQKPR